MYRVAVVETVERLLRENQRRTGLLFEQVSTRFVEEEELVDVDPQLRSLCNVNTPEEYAKALQTFSPGS